MPDFMDQFMLQQERLENAVREEVTREVQDMWRAVRSAVRDYELEKQRMEKRVSCITDQMKKIMQF